MIKKDIQSSRFTGQITFRLDEKLESELSVLLEEAIKNDMTSGQIYREIFRKGIKQINNDRLKK